MKARTRPAPTSVMLVKVERVLNDGPIQRLEVIWFLSVCIHHDSLRENKESVQTIQMQRCWRTVPGRRKIGSEHHMVPRGCNHAFRPIPTGPLRTEASQRKEALCVVLLVR